MTNTTKTTARASRARRRAATSRKEQTAQQLPTKDNQEVLYQAGKESNYYEFLQDPAIYEVVAEVKANGLYSTEADTTRIRFLCMNRQRSIAPEEQLVTMDYSRPAVDRINMVLDLNCQFLLSEAEALAEYLAKTYRYEAIVRQIYLPITSANCCDIASYSFVETPEIQTVLYPLDKEKTHLWFDVVAYYEVNQPLPFILPRHSCFQA